MVASSRLRGHAHAGRQLLIAVAVVLVLVLVARAYGPALHGTFIWDDHVLAEVDAPFRHVGLSKLLTESFWPNDALGDQRAPYYRPLVLLSLRADIALGGTPVEFHFTNVLLHLVACALLAFTAIRLGVRHTAAVVTALLWGLSPRLTESVAWISGRTDVLAGMFGLAALALSPETVEHPPANRVRLRSFFAGLCLLASLMAKEIGIAFAAALAVAALSRIESWRDRRRIARTAAYILVPLTLWLGLRTIALAGSKGPEHPLGIGRRSAAMLEAVGRYSEMIVDPARPQTSIGMLGETSTTHAVLGGLVLVGSFALVVRFRRRMPLGVRVGLTLVAVGLLPVLHLVPIALASSVVADRLLYVPLVGVMLVLGMLARGLTTNQRRLAGLAAIIATVLFFRATKARGGDYGNEALFWVNAAEQAHPHNVTSRNALALVVQQAEEVDLACRLYERSHGELRAGQHAWLTTHKRTMESLVSCWALNGRYDDALQLANELARRYPTSGRVFMGLGFARLHVRDFDGASTAFAQAVTLDRRLERIVVPVLRAMPRVRAEWQRLADSAGRTDKLAWARHLANVGRGPEAEAAYLELALDSSLPRGVQQPAVDYIVFEGSLPAAERAVVFSVPEIRRRSFLERLALRRAAHMQVDQLRSRIVSLAEVH